MAIKVDWDLVNFPFFKAQRLFIMKNFDLRALQPCQIFGLLSTIPSLLTNLSFRTHYSHLPSHSGWLAVHWSESEQVVVAASLLVSVTLSAFSIRVSGMMTSCTSTTRQALEPDYMANQLTRPLHHSNVSSVGARLVTSAGSHGGKAMFKNTNALDQMSAGGEMVRRVSGLTGTPGGRGVGPAKVASHWFFFGCNYWLYHEKWDWFVCVVCVWSVL